MNSKVDRSKLKPITRMRGEDDDETRELQAALQDARSYITSFTWCAGIEEEFFGLGVGGVVAVFLIRIRPVGKIDEWLWVIVGDLPLAYLVTDKAASPTRALEVYCEFMEDWVRAVRQGGDFQEVYPVMAEPTSANADLLQQRIVFLRSEMIPAFA